MMINCKKYYYTQKLNANADNSKRTWKLINEIFNKTGNNNSTIEALNIGESQTSVPSTICNYINTHFSTIGHKLANDLPLQ